MTAITEQSGEDYLALLEEKLQEATKAVLEALADVEAARVELARAKEPDAAKRGKIVPRENLGVIIAPNPEDPSKPVVHAAPLVPGVTSGKTFLELPAGGGSKVEFFDPQLKNTAPKKSRLTFIDGKNGILEHLGIRIEQWSKAENGYMLLSSSLVDTAMNSVFGDKYAAGVSTYDRMKNFEREVGRASIISGELQERLIKETQSADPKANAMDTLKKLTSLLNTDDKVDLKSEEAIFNSQVRVVALMPVLMALISRHSEGEDLFNTFVFPRAEDFGADFENFNFVENFAQMMGLKTDPATLKALETFLILHADHEMNASAFNAIATTSTDTPAWNIIGNAIGALAGANHGGANFQVLRQNERVLVHSPEEILQNGIKGIWAVPQEEIDARLASPDLLKLSNEEIAARARAFSQAFNNAKAANEGPLWYGRGHAVYSNTDPRSTNMRESGEQLPSEGLRGVMFKLAVDMEKEGDKNPNFNKGKAVRCNVDAFSGTVVTATGIKESLMTVFFAVGRAVGWLAQLVETIPPKTLGVKINRPDQVYVGDRGHDLHASIITAEAKAEGVTPDEFRARNTIPDATDLTDAEVVQVFYTAREQESGRAA